MCAALIELQRQDLMPHDSEVAAMEVYRAIMKPIADITDVIIGKACGWGKARFYFSS